MRVTKEMMKSGEALVGMKSRGSQLFHEEWKVCEISRSNDKLMQASITIYAELLTYLRKQNIVASDFLSLLICTFF